jgi:hypothetical protein
MSRSILKRTLTKKILNPNQTQSHCYSSVSQLYCFPQNQKVFRGKRRYHSNFYTSLNTSSTITPKRHPLHIFPIKIPTTPSRIYLDPLYFEFNIAMFASTVELGIAINVINGSDVMCDQRQDFFSSLLVDVVLLPGVGVLQSQ